MSGRPVRATRTLVGDYKRLHSGKIVSDMGVKKPKRKNKTPRKVHRVIKLNSSNGAWSVTPHRTPKSSFKDSNVDIINAVAEGDVVELPVSTDLEDQPEASQAEVLQAEVLEMKKKLEEQKVQLLLKKKEKLEKELAESQVEFEQLEDGGKNNLNNSGNRREKGGELDWEGLMDSSRLSEVQQEEGSKLPPFEAIKAMFVDSNRKESTGRESTRARRRKFKTVGVHPESESEGEPEGTPDGLETEEEGGTPKKKKKGKILSGIFAKASNTHIVKSVLHAHAMVDPEEVSAGDMTLSELPFHLLVAGELETVLSNILPEEQWSRLHVLKKLAYKCQYLKQDAILDSYAAFLRKVERGCSSGAPIKQLKNLKIVCGSNRLLVSRGSRVVEGRRWV